MKFGNRLALTLGLALIASACLGNSCFAQKNDTAALSARIAELGRVLQRLIDSHPAHHGIAPILSHMIA